MLEFRARAQSSDCSTRLRMVGRRRRPRFGLRKALIPLALIVTAESAASPRDDSSGTSTPASCVVEGSGKEKESSPAETRFLVNRCSESVEAAICLHGGTDPRNECGGKKFYRWRFVLKPNEVRHSKFQMPPGGELKVNACFGGHWSIAKSDEDGNLYCKPPSPGEIAFDVDMPCSEGAKPSHASVVIEHGRPYAKTVKIRTDANRVITFSRSTMRRWPKPDERENPEQSRELVIEYGGKPLHVLLTPQTLQEAICGDLNAEETKIPSALVEKLRKQRAPCLPEPGKPLPAYCFKLTKQALPPRG